MAQQSLSPREIEHYTNYWCKCRGITAEDLASHPQIDDIMLLLHIHDEFSQDFSKSEQSVWGQKWGWCYNRQLPLKKKYRLKLEQICLSALARRQAKQAAREKIQQLRQA